MRQFDVSTAGRHAGACKGSLRLAMGVGLALSVAGLLRAALPQAVDASENFPDSDTLENVILSVSDDGSTLDLSGPIVFGVKQRMREVLEAHPGITTVRLTSPGGRVVEARDLSEMIAQRGLTTIAIGNCASACTVLFMAGRDRVVTPTSTLGFHRYRSPDRNQQEAEENMAIDRRYFSARGLPDWFIERAFTTPNNGMWRPTRDEMRVANVITAELADDGRRIPVAGPPQAELHLDRERRVEGGANVNASEAAR